MTKKDQMRTQFESDWKARITKSRTVYQRRMNYSYVYTNLDFVNPDMKPQEEKISIMQVEISEPDLDVMIKQLHEANLHACIQNKYPHLRAAYMEYLMHVHMTVDSDLL